MITLKSKIIRNFTAGILACVLVFSILVTLFVTFNYQELIKKNLDSRPTQVSNWFKKVNNDPSYSKEDMQEGLENLARDLEVDIYFEEPDGAISYPAYGRNKINNYLREEKKFPVFNINRSRRSGTLHVIYNGNFEPVKKMQRDFSMAIVYSLSISLLIGFIISLILSENISEPIMKISDETINLKDGNYKTDDSLTDIKEIETLQTNINYLSNNLQKQEEIRKQYAQDISHELRTPLTNLQLYIEAIKDGVIDPDENTMTVLLEDVKRLEGLIEGLKKTFDEKVEYLEINKEDFNISELTDSIVQSFKANAEINNIDINTFIQEEINFYSDSDKYSQILQNLISNAIKAIGTDGEINVYLNADANEIVLRVTDDGVGIAEDKIDRIFERFYRIEDARNTKENGHGLGLSITKNFVDALGGKIEVDSKENVGTTFILTFIR
ncbi:sensor histidine kinase [Anaerococcus sp. DFU013_CI05]|uniref:sensor histidine kinase n=1 Tax=unclassified Anaerococcus TaxID=2614126 RepID=UPI0019344E6F|nr:HAMP domain-containing sensor histidine kinase [Anaerococcus sp. mt242]MBM0046925.1 HAMP domain-containing histidine kinase [Anaerococcus sp. mt242]